jgi:hypothetical protein
MSSSLPEDGEARVGSVTLPAGRRIVAGFGSGQPVAWATSESVPDPGRVWSDLSDVSPQTGLVPFLLRSLDDLMLPILTRMFPDEVQALADGAHGEAGRPWANDEFGDPEDIAGLDRIDGAQMLARLWQGQLPFEMDFDDEVVDDYYEEDDDDEELLAMRAPFAADFPGLAPAQELPVTAKQIHQILGSLPPARIGLAAASRPADVLPLIGWQGAVNGFGGALPIAAVLRSWEQRFGAKLLQVGFAEISVLASRPPRTADVAQLLAAEQFAFCDECAGRGLHDIKAITDYLLDSPVWTFWWD